MQVNNFRSLSVSSIFIVLAAIFTLALQFDPSLKIYGLNSSFLNQGAYHMFAMQIFTSQFFHGSLMHFLMNAIFIFVFGSAVESILGEKKYIFFFLFTSIVIGIGISLLSNTNTIGISGFAMAVMAYYTLHLKKHNNPDYKGGITALSINLVIGFIPGISFLGHLIGALSGLVFFLFTHNTKK